MYLLEISHMPSFSPFRVGSKRALPTNFDLIARSFDESIQRRIKSLYSPSISLSWLSLAVDFLSSTHAEALTMISNLRSSSPSLDDSLASYLDHSVKLLDICNSISSEIERLRQRRLLINFVLHLLQFPGDDRQIPVTDKLLKAKDTLSDWDNNSQGFAKRRGFQIHDPEILIKELSSGLGSAPHGKISSAVKLVRRTIYVVGFLTVFFSGVLVSALYGLPEIITVDVKDEFVWADSFNGLQSAIREELNRRLVNQGRTLFLGEVNDVSGRMSKMRKVVDDVVLGDKDKEEFNKETLRNAVKELETVTDRFCKGLDRLSNGVNGMFHTVLCTRNGMLENYRVTYDKQLK